MQLQKIVLLVLGCALAACSNPVDSKCVLPVPDNGDVRHNPANLEGEIVQISGAFLTIKALKSSTLTSVKLDEKLPIYTAFGGDGRISELKTGLHVWVWYTNCKPVEQGGTAKAAYFQVYSFDPNDQPKIREKKQNRPPK
jgi:hypothetical protein